MAHDRCSKTLYIPSVVYKLLILVAFFIFACHDVWLGIKHYKAGQRRSALGRVLTGSGLLIMGLAFPFWILEPGFPPIIGWVIILTSIVVYVYGLSIR